MASKRAPFEATCVRVQSARSEIVLFEHPYHDSCSTADQEAYVKLQRMIGALFYAANTGVGFKSSDSDRADVADFCRLDFAAADTPNPVSLACKRFHFPAAARARRVDRPRKLAIGDLKLAFGSQYSSNAVVQVYLPNTPPVRVRPPVSRRCTSGLRASAPSNRCTSLVVGLMGPGRVAAPTWGTVWLLALLCTLA